MSIFSNFLGQLGNAYSGALSALSGAPFSSSQGQQITSALGSAQSGITSFFNPKNTTIGAPSGAGGSVSLNSGLTQFFVNAVCVIVGMIFIFAALDVKATNIVVNAGKALAE